MDLFYYKGYVESVYDGDTMTITLDLGFSMHAHKVKVRLLGVNTPELRGGTEQTKKAGYEARDFVRNLCLHKHVFIRSEKKGKYGRYLATVWHIEEGICAEKSINDLLVEKELAVPYMV